jgi:signal transduction histidine kinase
MGLSISRSLMDSPRGRLWATPNPDHGATFHLALPGMR